MRSVSFALSFICVVLGSTAAAAQIQNRACRAGETYSSSQKACITFQQIPAVIYNYSDTSSTVLALEVPSKKPVPQAETPPPPIDQNKKADLALKGLHLGLGISASTNLGGVSQVTMNEARTVRVGRDNSSAARLLFEMHYFFSPSLFGWNDYLNENNKNWSWAPGPFVSLNTEPVDQLGKGDSQVFDSLGFGLMLGFKEANEPNSLNFGIGALVDTNHTVLARGVKDGGVAPAGLTADQLTRQETTWGAMFVVSYRFLNLPN